MTFSLGQLRKTLMGGLPPEVAAFARGVTDAEKHLGTIFLTVVQSYQATLKDSRLSTIVPRLQAVGPELRGFAYEGAGMGLMQLDCLLPWKRRLARFLAGPAARYACPTSVGAGLALARLKKQPEAFLDRFDPLLCWYAIDGYGFRYGIFARQQSLVERVYPQHLSPQARPVFDQGLGRSLWFGNGADPARIAPLVEPFPAARQGDLWAGAAFACAYAGGAARAQVAALLDVAPAYRAHLAVGAALGARERQLGGNLVPHSELACELLCGLSAAQAAARANEALQDLPADRSAYALWRQRIAAGFAVPVA
jgi:hypothetical protein